MTTTPDDTNGLKAKLRSRKAVSLAVPPLPGLSSGSTLLNLATTGTTSACYLPGHYYLLVGDSASGKTWLALSLFAEACLSPVYEDYRLVFDNAENGALMDVTRYFGSKTAGRLEPPSGTRKAPVYSTTVEQFYDHVDRLAKTGPFVYILDSMDVLTTEDEQGQFAKERRGRALAREVTGSYGTSKAKRNSSGMRLVFNRLRQTGSILLLVSQTRDNIGFGSQFQPKTRAGGHALTFYAALEIWTSIKDHLKKPVRGKPRELGIVSKVRVRKNRLTGKDRTVFVPIYHSAGIDDVGSCVDYLVEEGRWPEAKGKIEAAEFGFAGGREALVELVEGAGRERELRRLVAEVWNEVEDACAVKRKRRYE